ncbi:MAG: hypothetical protein AMJ79_07740 [Phycisphaerae bacterium SM23_30]|nr:MAG: hypothetical protein AMJ79_07740 [Phycisphaerae bacterium SM23_30]
MNLLRHNTDYAFRMMGNLAGKFNEKVVPVRVLAQEEQVSYQFACKILQKLHEAGLVASIMGPKGGYRLSRPPDRITMLEIIKAVQGNVAVNQCTVDWDVCPRRPTCPLNGKLCQLQQMVDNYLTDVTLEEIVQSYNL